MPDSFVRSDPGAGAGAQENCAAIHAMEACHRLIQVPGIGVLNATALVATLGNARQFRNDRHLSAFLGLVPRQHSSGGKQYLGGVSKHGDAYIPAPIADSWHPGVVHQTHAEVQGAVSGKTETTVGRQEKENQCGSGFHDESQRPYRLGVGGSTAKIRSESHSLAVCRS